MVGQIWYWCEEIGGNMMSRARAGRGDGMKFLLQHADTKSEDCVLWPYSKTGLGYGSITFEGRTQAANRVMLILTCGLPEGRFVAAHTCRNKSCINPNHLRWASNSENQSDRVKDGTSNRGSACGSNKLSEDQVLEIIRLHRSGISRRALAQQFDVTVWTVHAIFQGKSWTWLTREVAA